MIRQQVLRVEKYKRWSDLVEAALRYESQGISCEARGWDDIRYNKLTVYGDFGGGNKCQMKN